MSGRFGAAEENGCAGAPMSTRGLVAAAVIVDYYWHGDCGRSRLIEGGDATAAVATRANFRERPSAAKIQSGIPMQR